MSINDLPLGLLPQFEYAAEKKAAIEAVIHRLQRQEFDEEKEAVAILARKLAPFPDVTPEDIADYLKDYIARRRQRILAEISRSVATDDKADAVLAMLYPNDKDAGEAK